MKRLFVYLFVSAAALIGISLLVSSAFGQDAPPELLRQAASIGRVRPNGIAYEPNFDRFVWTNANTGQLQIVDARTFQPIHTLYDDFDFGRHYTLSHNGQYIAVANQRVVDLFEMNTGTLLASIEPNGSRGIQSPLIFSDDDSYLLISTIVPERPELRRSENDTTIVPYIWDVANALDIARSRLPGRVDALPFFDNRNGFILAPDNLIIAALPRRLQLFDLDGDVFEVLGEIQTERFEQDPVDIWFSAFDDVVYHRPVNSSELIQIDAETLMVTRIPLGASLGAQNMRSLADVRFGSVSVGVGQPNDRAGNSLIRALLGDDYARSYNDHPITLALVDVLDPLTVPESQRGLLIYVLDETTGRGTFDLIQPRDVLTYAVNPDKTNIALLMQPGVDDGAIKIYELATGVLRRTIQPAVRGTSADGTLFAYNAAGDQLLLDFQRFDVATGAVVAQDLAYGDPFTTFRFAPNSAALITERNLGDRYEWWEWSIPEAEVIRREIFPVEFDVVLRNEPARGRTLTQITRGELQGVEFIDLVSGTREQLLFDALPGRIPDAIYPSDDWRHVLAVYGVSQYSPHFPGSEIVIYRFGTGAVWHYAGSDLPFVDSRDYGWVDDQTAYVSGVDFGSGSAPERIYGLQFDATGVPQCLVDAFPDEWTQWIPLWQQLTLTLRGADLMALARRLCDALPATVVEIEGVFFPTPTPTRPFFTPTPAVIAGVPACLTQRFAREAVGYAQSWRALTEGLTAEQAAELEALLCEGLSSAGAPPSDQASDAPPQQVYLIDVGAGERAAGAFIPRRSTERVDINTALIADAYRRQTGGLSLGEFVLSPDQRLIAVRDGDGMIDIYELLTPYSDLAAFATQTAEPGRTFDPRVIGVQATPTQPFDDIGGAQPTLTPTITPTSPPPASQVYDLPQRGQISELCPLARYTTDNAPESHAPTGQILVRLFNESLIYRLDPRTGDLRPDELIPRCESCQASPGGAWVLRFEDGIAVSRPDGREYRQLFTDAESPFIFGVRWFDANTVIFNYDGFLPDRRGSRTLVQYYDVTSDTYSEAVEQVYFSPEVNDVFAETISEQPRGGDAVVARQAFTTGTGIGYQYYIVDRARGETHYIARLVEPGNTSVQTIWHPSGDTLYYKVGDDVNWYVYDPATGQRFIYGRLPEGDSLGVLSRSERFSVRRTFAQFNALIPGDQVRPSFELYDLETGSERRYCFESEVQSWALSPDERFAVVRLFEPSERDLDTVRQRTYILDLMTGDLIEIVHPRALDIENILVWTE